MPANTAMPMFLTFMRQKYTYVNMAENELLCVRVVTLLRSKDASTQKSDVIRQCLYSKLSRFFVLLFLLFTENIFAVDQ